MMILNIAVMAASIGSASPLVPHESKPGIYTFDAIAASQLPLDDITLTMRIGEQTCQFELERFTVTDEQTRFLLGSRGGKDRLMPFDPTSVILLRGSAGMPESEVFLAMSPHGVIGTASLPDGSWALTPGDGSRGLAATDLSWHQLAAGERPPLGVPVCGATLGAAPPPLRSLDLNQDRLRLDLAVETDFEYLELFSGDTIAAAEYLVAMYGAVAMVYERDVDIEMVLVWSRLWETSDDLFNDDDPLVPFRDYWNKNMGDIDRDLAQFLTGRTNLPYGGVAWVSATCGDHAYSVSGYTLGSFYSATEPAFGNWDINVAAHELGHNCGTYHTHDYEIDNCAGGDINRGSIMSYCHTTTGGNANIDLRFHEITQAAMREHVDESPCLIPDCNGNGDDDAIDITSGASVDINSNGVPDECEDCNSNAIFDDVDIADGSSLDLDANGVPDECQPDCNGNSQPDTFDISEGTSIDLWGNGVPDECETDCDSDGQSDYNQIQSNMDLDLNRNAILDACEDCDSDGTPDHLQLAGGSALWIAGTTNGEAQGFHASSGVPITSASGDSVTAANDLRVIDDEVFISDFTGNRVSIFDRPSGTYIDELTEGLLGPDGMATNAAGELLVVSRGTSSVERFDVASRTHLGTLIASGEGGLLDPRAILILSDGNILVSTDEDAVLEFTGDGNFVRELISADAVDLDWIRGMAERPSGTILITSSKNNAIYEFDRDTGDSLGRWDRGGLEEGYWGLGSPWSVRIGPDGDVYVSTNEANTAVQVYEEATGLFKRRYYILSQLIPGPTGFDFAPPADDDCDGNLVLDSCDIAEGTHTDANENGIPDVCECVADHTGDGVVGVDDLLYVTANWGSPFDADDLLKVIAGWGNCP
ncbi:MAG: hypothetical protein GY876_08740 [Planctomycetes bacterium]|nr:hypothetical protein [Planctomycetota bacterium]